MSDPFAETAFRTGIVGDESLDSSVATQHITDQGVGLLDPDLVFPSNRPVVAVPKKLAGSTRRHFGRPKRLKKGTNSHDEDGTSKRRCIRDAASILDVTAETIHRLDPHLSPEEIGAVIDDYKNACRILNSKRENKTNTIPSLEYMISLVNDWRPKREMICMYVRWSKRLRRDYHLDSITTLLCISKQCDYKPYLFLKNIKTLSIVRSTTTYGMNFRFDTSNNQAIDDNKLNQKFLGLSITLRLLQQAVVPSAGILGSVGLKTSSKISGSTEGLIMTEIGDRNQKYLVADKPTSRFHTASGLTGRIWMAIQHRWISLQVVEMLFPSQLAKCNSEHESLAFSFQMHACSGPTRYDYLDPIIGVCLRYRSTLVIDNHQDILQTVWTDPRSFVPFGNRLLQGVLEKDRIQFIAETFHHLQSLIQTGKSITLHKKTDRNVKWQMIRGYAFHFWLERCQNEKIKESIESSCKKSLGLKCCKKTLASTRQSEMQANHEAANPFMGPNSLLPHRKEEYAFQQRPKAKYNTDIPLGGLSNMVTTRQAQGIVSTTSAVRNGPAPEGISHVPANLSTDSNTGDGLPIMNWNSIRLASQSEITSLVSSHLLIHRDDGITVLEELSPLEVYSADMLYRYRHSRQTGKHSVATIMRHNGVVLSIDAEVQQFIDLSSKSFHVAREDSSFFKEHGHLVPSILQISNLCQGIFKYGKSDETRSPAQFRVNIGCGGQHRLSGIPERLVGLHFKKQLQADLDYNAEDIMETIGRLTEFTWNIMKDMQETACDIALAPDPSRHRQYARHLSEYIGMNSDIGFEDITLVVGFLYPTMPNITEHVDIMNDSIAGYTRTGAFNVVLLMGEEQNITLVHLQVICNFRRVVREYILPMQSLLRSIVGHCRVYLAKWQANINHVFGGKTEQLPSPLDRSNFFVDDCLPFERILISSESTKTPAIGGEYLITEISPSRVLSFSMFIDPIVDLRETLCYDQQMELCFVASMLSNPFWFEYTISSLTKKHFEKGDTFQFNVHPLYDWIKETISVFGAWQGGPYNRWSPCGGSTPFPNLFGAHSEATDLDIKNGQRRLRRIMQVLHHHLQWVDHLHQSSKEVAPDLSISTIDQHMTRVTETIFKIVPCQFSVFRLMVFTTISAGCGLIKGGTHLKSLMYPVKGSASFNHLMKPDPHQITNMKAMSLCRQEGPILDICDNKKIEFVEANRHDQLMLYVSYELGMQKYLRDETECILCESHPNRNLHCRDWFKKGRRIYDMDMEGNLLQREYGSNMPWVQMRSSEMVKFAFLHELVVYVDEDETVKVSAIAFAEYLRRVHDSYQFRGSGTRLSGYVQEYKNRYDSTMEEQYPAFQFRAADFYYGCHVRNMDTIQVLGDGEVAVHLPNECNDIMKYPDGVRLWNSVLKLLYGCVDVHSMYGACYHQQQEDPSLVSKTLMVTGHLDNAFVERAILLPLTLREFFTVLAIPSSWHVQQHDESYKRIQIWMEGLPTDEIEGVHAFFSKFLLMARVAMKIFDIDVRIFSNTAGSVLAFPGNQCFHASIIPGSISGMMNPRDLFILHTATDKNR